MYILQIKLNYLKTQSRFLSKKHWNCLNSASAHFFGRYLYNLRFCLSGPAYQCINAKDQLTRWTIRNNLIDAKYQKIAFLSVPTNPPIPSQTKLMPKWYILNVHDNKANPRSSNWTFEFHKCMYFFGLPFMVTFWLVHLLPWK